MEFVRHRVFSFAQESTRYCNYSKDKFGNELTFIIPEWLDDRQLVYQNSEELLLQFHKIPKVQEFKDKDREELIYLFSLATSENNYLQLLEEGWTAQQARSILPNSLKTELVMTGFESDWNKNTFQIQYKNDIIDIVRGFFGLRCPGSAHPQARELAIPLEQEFKIYDYRISK